MSNLLLMLSVDFLPDIIVFRRKTIHLGNYLIIFLLLHYLDI